MPSRGHSPITFEDFRGNYSRILGGFSSSYVRVPKDYFAFSQNITFFHRSFGMRPGVTVAQASPVNVIKRFHVYQRTDTATPRYIILGNGGNFYDTGSAAPATPIATVVGAEDFRMVVINNRCYITPFTYTNNEAVPISGAVVFVWDGTTSRNAAGSPPSGFTIGAATGAAGIVEAGRYIIALAYETASGFITPWGPATFTQYTAPGGAQIDLTNLNNGPAGTVAKWVGITKPIIAWDGNQNNHELFKVLRIPNNTTTTASLNFYTADLIDSGDYLHDELTSIPAGVNIGIYSNRLMVHGPFGSESQVLISNASEYESFSSIEGFRNIYPGDGGGLKNGIEHLTSYYLYKSSRCYVTIDNGDVPSKWPVNIVDGALGAEPHSIATALDSQGQHRDRILIANQNGLFDFAGRFNPKALSWNIDADWRLIPANIIPKMEVAFIPFGPLANFAIVTCSLSANDHPDRCLIMDFSDDITPEKVKWTHWTFTRLGDAFNMIPLVKPIRTGVVFAYRITTTPVSNFCTLDTTVRGSDRFTGVEDSPISTIWDLPYLPIDVDDQARFHLHYIVLVFGSAGTGTISSFITVENTFSASANGPNFAIPTVNNRRTYQVCDFESESIALRFTNNVALNKFVIRGIVAGLKPSGTERPM